jgi:hypothetical protein
MKIKTGQASKLPFLNMYMLLEFQFLLFTKDSGED